MSAPSISKIHVTNSTGLSLNDRFTAIKTHPEPSRIDARRRNRSRSRSTTRTLPVVNRAASVANRRLLQQLARRHKMQAALKLKRRSLRTFGGGNGAAMKRGSIKALRLAPNGRPIRTNSLAKVATMNADYIPNNGTSRRTLRRSNSTSSLSGRLGVRRPILGGAAQRVAQRRIERTRGRSQQRLPQQQPLGGRSRSRSRGRVPAANVRGRSLSGARNAPRRAAAPVARSRSRSRGRLNRPLPVQARLGIRQGTAAAAGARGGRGASISRRGVAAGRVQKRRNSMAQGGAVGAGGGGPNGAAGRVGRARGRSAIRNAAGRSRSRTRKGSVGQQQQWSGGKDRGGLRRGRSQQRNARGAGATQRNGKARGMNGQRPQQQQQHQQQRRGRSRSRGGRGGPGGRNLGRNLKQDVNKDELDKELDTYMATTKNENDMDYLLKN